MAFGVFIHRTDSIYDDSPAVQYQFPRQYLRRANACVGDWIVYYEPRKVTQTRGYFAVAKVGSVISDPKSSEMYLALIEPGTYLDFAKPVPFSDQNGVTEQGVLNEEGKLSGRAQSAVRPLSPEDFRRIVERGLDTDNPLLPRTGAPLPSGFEDEQTPFLSDFSRVRASFTVSRIVRDRVFRQVVLTAYDSRCAVTGLKLINGGGRAEVEAAHIRPVEADGPDIISNGLALSGTAHWMFDRGLISLGDDLRILISRHVNDPGGIEAMINRGGKALAPDRRSDRPHPDFLRWHREHCFKQ